MQNYTDFFEKVTPITIKKKIVNDRTIKHPTSSPTTKHSPPISEPIIDTQLFDNNTSTATPTVKNTSQQINHKNLPKKEKKHLQNGKIKISHYCDLHGHKTHEVAKALDIFFCEANKNNIKYAKIIHGKGTHSENCIPIIKPYVHHILSQNPLITGYCEAGLQNGGSGATLIKFKSNFIAKQHSANN